VSDTIKLFLEIICALGAIATMVGVWDQLQRKEKIESSNLPVAIKIGNSKNVTLKNNKAIGMRLAEIDNVEDLNAKGNKAVLFNNARIISFSILAIIFSAAFLWLVKS
jgi:hypothetical protein